MKPKRKYIIIKMTRVEALSKDSLTCNCRHPENNHFDFGKNPCARCECEEYVERPRVGEIL